MRCGLETVDDQMGQLLPMSDQFDAAALDVDAIQSRDVVAGRSQGIDCATGAVPVQGPDLREIGPQFATLASVGGLEHDAGPGPWRRAAPMDVCEPLAVG